jgi:hypothetical protein
VLNLVNKLRFTVVLGLPWPLSLQTRAAKRVERLSSGRQNFFTGAFDFMWLMAQKVQDPA